MLGLEIDLEKYIIEDNKIIISQNQKGKITLFSSQLLVSKLEIVIEENSQVEILEIDEKDNLHITFFLKDNVNVMYNVFTSNQAYNSKRVFNLEKNCSLTTGYADFSIGNKDVQIDVNLLGEHSEADFHLASLTKKIDKKNYFVNFVHKNQFTKGLMDNYGVCQDTSTLNFISEATIEKGAKKSIARQNAKIVVFDKKCHAKASPKLCIYENDVEASHGASEGQVNPDHVYYLMSRGLDETTSKRLIIIGYLQPITRYFSNKTISEKIHDCVFKGI